MERTDWYPASVEPVRSGLYETKLLSMSDIQMRYWNKWQKQWYWLDTIRSDFGHPMFPNAKWRGLTEESK